MLSGKLMALKSIPNKSKIEKGFSLLSAHTFNTFLDLSHLGNATCRSKCANPTPVSSAKASSPPASSMNPDPGISFFQKEINWKHWRTPTSLSLSSFLFQPRLEGLGWLSCHCPTQKHADYLFGFLPQSFFRSHTALSDCILKNTAYK